MGRLLQVLEDHDHSTAPARRGSPARAAHSTVLVLWTGYPPGPRVCASLKRGGFRVIGAYPEHRMGGRSSSCLSPRRYPSPTAQPDRFMGAVARICREEGVAAVVALDEDIVRLLAERGHELHRVTIVGPGASQYLSLCDKLELTRIARELGLDTPDTVVVDGNGPNGPWPSLPSIVKPRTSRSEEAKPMAVDTVGERDAYVAELVAGGHDAIVQERIIGPRWVIQSVRGPGVFECVVFQVRDMWPRGAGLASVKRPSEPPPGLVSAARALLDHADYCGPSGISFMERDGRFYPHDANLRLGATTAASLHSGFDFPRRAVEVALGADGVPFSGAFRAGTHMRFDLELEALVDAWKRRRDGGRPGVVARRIAAVGLSPRGMLDPSPFDAFWFGPLFARAARRVIRPIRRALRARMAA